MQKSRKERGERTNTGTRLQIRIREKENETNMEKMKMKKISWRRTEQQQEYQNPKRKLEKNEK